MKKISKLTLQEWIPIKEISEEGVVKLKNEKLIKIIKVNPINYNLKSNLEKEAILNSYKLFLKSFNFNSLYIRNLLIVNSHKFHSVVIDYLLVSYSAA